MSVCLTGLIACVRDPNKQFNPGTSGGQTEGGDNDTIAVPEYKDYKRGTINFSDIVYTRPDMAGTVSEFENVSQKIVKNDIPYSEQLQCVYGLENDYASILTMSAYANVRSSQDSSDIYWSGEYEYISTNYPAFAKAVEELFVSAASSPHAKSFEEDYFGDGLIEEYKDGGIYTPKIVSLMAEEAELEADYSAISTATVIISYNGITDTVDNILEYYRGIYGDKSRQYELIESGCTEIYERETDRLYGEILVELFKTRREISDELGYESYATLAYEQLYHDYSPEQFEDFTEDIADYIVPVYVKLSSYIFNQYSGSKPKEIGRTELINNVYEMLEGTSTKLYEIYSYMLQHSLFDIENKSSTRFEGAFTTYYDLYNAPFIFMTLGGTIEDYTTLYHEFGHFADAFVNYGAETSLDLAEVSSQALELLSLTQIDGILSDQETKYLTVYEMENALMCLIFQGFYATFEHIAYGIPLDEISRSSLNDAVALAADKIGINSNILNDIYYVMIPHVFLYPFYVQSYCTSVTVALEIYFEELDDEGAGFEIYEELITREDTSMTFEEYLTDAKLTSPFEENHLKKIADRIHYELLGSHYFINTGGTNNST